MKIKLAILCTLVTVASASTPLINTVKIQGNKITVQANHQFTDSYLKEDFFVEYDDSIPLQNLGYSVITAPFILAIMPIIWYSNKKYSIKEMDEDLYKSLEVIHSVFKLFWPQSKWVGELIPEKLINNNSESQQSENALALLFSKGLDAACTSYCHYENPQLLILYQGADISLNNTDRWDGVKNQVLEFANEHNRQAIFVRSNFYTVIKKFNGALTSWWARTSQGLSYSGLAMPILYARGYKKLLIGSSRTIDYPDPYGSHPVIENLIRFAGIKVKHDGGNYTRLEKIKKIIEMVNKYSTSKPSLRVCPRYNSSCTCVKCLQMNTQLKNYSNCNDCKKCILTITELLVENENPADWGFNITIPEAINRIKQFIQTNLKKSGSGMLWHWLCVRDFVASKSADEFNPAIKELVEWLKIDSSPYFYDPETTKNNETVDKKLASTALLNILNQYIKENEITAVRGIRENETLERDFILRLLWNVAENLY